MYACQFIVEAFLLIAMDFHATMYHTEFLRITLKCHTSALHAIVIQTWPVNSFANRPYVYLCHY